MSKKDALVAHLNKQYFNFKDADQISFLKFYLITKYEKYHGLDLENLDEREHDFIDFEFRGFESVNEILALFSLPKESTAAITEAFLMTFFEFANVSHRIFYSDEALFHKFMLSGDIFNSDEFKTLFEASKDLSWLKAFFYSKPKFAFLFKLDADLFKKLTAIRAKQVIRADKLLQDFRNKVFSKLNLETEHEHERDEYLFKATLKAYNIDELAAVLSKVTKTLNEISSAAKAELAGVIDSFIEERYRVRFDEALEYNSVDRSLKMPNDETVYRPISPNTFKFINELYNRRNSPNDSMTITDALGFKGNLKDHILTSDAAEKLYAKYIEQGKARHYRLKNT
jgi:hypothetical protein